MNGISPALYGTGAQNGMLALDEPVIVLTCARSGSTLLRLILDAHPELACPAETNIVKICSLLGQAWQLVDPPSSGEELSRMASASVKAAVNTVFTSYLLRNGKRRWCDKSLGTARGLRPFVDLYPKAKFICLYRHCMDVIDSGLEASPFGLLGYGFDSYAARSSGNSVAAIAGAWCEDTARALQFEESYPERCHRVYYEQVVQDPEAVASEMLAFIGVAPDPGITRRCFDAQHDFSGPGDHKVTATTRISAGSVGRGLRVPTDLLPPPLLNGVNELLGRLGYPVVDHNWRRSIRPPALPGWACAVAAPVPDKRSAAQLDRVGELVTERTGRRLGQPLPAAARAAVGPAKKVGLVAYCPGPDPVARSWRFDLDRGTSAVADCAAGTGDPDVDWLVTGEVRTWLSVLSGDENIAASLRARTLRCVDYLGWDGQAIAEANKKSHSYRVLISHLLGLDGQPVTP
jgi:Sulfotransferase family